MKIVKTSVNMGIIVFLAALLLFPNIAVADIGRQNQNDNAILFIYGGFGVHFTIINENNKTVNAQYDIFAKGLFFNKTWHRHGSFSAAPGVWTTPRPVIVPYSFMLISAYLYTDNGQFLNRNGVSVIGFVLFLM